MAVVAPSFQDLVTIGQAEAQSRRGDLAFLDGDVTTMQLHGSAAMADKTIEVGAQLFRATMFDGAEGDDLTALVDDRCNIQRHPATFAQTTLTFNRTSSGSSGTIPQGTRCASVANPDGTQIVFTTDADYAVPAGSNGAFAVSATATASGPEANIHASSGVTKILDPLFDSTFSVAQLVDAGGGNLQESDPELRRRARLFFITLYRGTLAALEYAALLIPSVRIAHAIENTDTGFVTVVVSDSTGSSTQQMCADVIAEEENWRCAGVTLAVVRGLQLTLDMTVQLAAVAPGFSTAGATAAIISRVTDKINARKGGDTVYLDQVRGAILSVSPDNIEAIKFPQILVGGNPWLGSDVIPPAVNYTLRAGTIQVVGPDGT